MATELSETPMDLLASSEAEAPAASSSSDAAGAGAEANGGPAAPAAPARQPNLYFVRVPRPHVDDAPVKELQTKLSAVLAKLKDYNGKLAAKRVRTRRGRQRDGRATRDGPRRRARQITARRSVLRSAAARSPLPRAPPSPPTLQEVVGGLRQQVAVARSLKEEAAPEWQDKVRARSPAGGWGRCLLRAALRRVLALARRPPACAMLTLPPAAALPPRRSPSCRS